jgi:hypothetical protein
VNAAMDHQTNVVTAKRRTREEIRQVVSEFATSGMQQSEFCGSRGRPESLPGMEIFARSFKPKRQLLVGGQGIALEEFLSYPAGHWLK